MGKYSEDNGKVLLPFEFCKSLTIWDNGLCIEEFLHFLKNCSIQAKQGFGLPVEKCPGLRPDQVWKLLKYGLYEICGYFYIF